ncbi:MAG: RsmD family RNA methyltransferase, partial [Proteobacteria bacterium]|nr:RsmD family RNA methyltransferase [Pseudomonadota bacterium]
MRIIAGIFKGISLNVVSNVGAESGLRPTTDRVRENIFNILSGGRFDDPLTNARVLDLFSGTGALG